LNKGATSYRDIKRQRKGGKREKKDIDVEKKPDKNYRIKKGKQRKKIFCTREKSM
jgi:hypothetical protein